MFNHTLHRRVFEHYALPIYLVFILYVSLIPMQGWSFPKHNIFILLLKFQPLVTFDITVNILAYLPLGILSYRLLQLYCRYPFLLNCVSGILLSTLLECTQAFLPSRVTSNLDILSNTIGVLMGSLLVYLSEGNQFFKHLLQLGKHLFKKDVPIEKEIILILIWILAQSNPLIPFLGAGNFFLHNSYQLVEGSSLIKIIAVVFNSTGLGLLISLLLNSFVLLSTISLMGFALFLKLVISHITLKVYWQFNSYDWITAYGSLFGIFLVLIFKNLIQKTRIYLSGFLILSGGILSKINAHYDPWAQMLTVFDWHHGHLLHFMSLTQWLYEIWPLATFVVLWLGYRNI